MSTDKSNNQKTPLKKYCFDKQLARIANQYIHYEYAGDVYFSLSASKQKVHPKSHAGETS